MSRSLDKRIDRRHEDFLEALPLDPGVPKGSNLGRDLLSSQFSLQRVESFWCGFPRGDSDDSSQPRNKM